VGERLGHALVSDPSASLGFGFPRLGYDDLRGAKNHRSSLFLFPAVADAAKGSPIVRWDLMGNFFPEVGIGQSLDQAHLSLSVKPTVFFFLERDRKIGGNLVEVGGLGTRLSIHRVTACSLWVDRKAEFWRCILFLIC